MISSSGLRGEIVKQLSLKKWGYKRLALETGFSESSVRSYMSDCGPSSPRFEIAVTRALDIHLLDTIVPQREVEYHE